MSTFEVDLVKDSTMQNIAAILAAQGAGQGSHGLQVKSYDDVLSIVRLGLAPQIFSVGDVIEVGRETKVQASLGEHTGITAVSVDEDKFVTAMDEAGEKEYEIIFDGSAWKYGDLPIILADYGLSVTGTAVAGDTIIVVETASTINMVVMDFIKDGQTSKGNIKLHDKTKKYGMILQSEKLLYNLQFDSDEALYFCEEGLAAGTYHFNIPTTWSKAAAGDYQFTLTKAVPAGGQIAGLYRIADVEPTSWTVTTYASPSSTTAIETVAVTSGSAGTDLGALNVAVTGNMNSIHRVGYGSNRWSTSAMRQHLNSGKAAGSVWAPQTNFDRPPSWVTNTAGFMHGLDPEFIKICADVELLTALSTAAGDTTAAEGSAGTGFETTVDKFFLPSRPEVFAGSDNTSDKGDAWQYYAANSDVPGGASNANADSNRIKVNTSGSPTYWWLRSPDDGHGHGVRYIGPSGSVVNGSAYSSYGVAPACVVA